MAARVRNSTKTPSFLLQTSCLASAMGWLSTWPLCNPLVPPSFLLNHLIRMDGHYTRCWASSEVSAAVLTQGFLNSSPNPSLDSGFLSNYCPLFSLPFKLKLLENQVSPPRDYHVTCSPNSTAPGFPLCTHGTVLSKVTSDFLVLNQAAFHKPCILTDN